MLVDTPGSYSPSEFQRQTRREQHHYWLQAAAAACWILGATGVIGGPLLQSLANYPGDYRQVFRWLGIGCVFVSLLLLLLGGWLWLEAEERTLLFVKPSAEKWRSYSLPTSRFSAGAVDKTGGKQETK